MARPKSFDADDVLQKATELFWSRGYDGTSIRDLEKHLGVGRQSLYDTFGDKHALFLKALSNYASDSVRLRAALDGPNAGLAELEGFLETMVCFATPVGPRPACFIVNTVAELGDDDAEVSGVCEASREGVTASVANAIGNAARNGEIPAPESIGAAADFLVAQIYGLLLLGKNGASRERLRSAARQALRGIT